MTRAYDQKRIQQRAERVAMAKRLIAAGRTKSDAARVMGVSDDVFARLFYHKSDAVEPSARARTLAQPVRCSNGHLVTRLPCGTCGSNKRRR